ncbi:MAG: COG2426 family protein [Candidatus Hydrothermarchaeales archaeon]
MILANILLDIVNGLPHEASVMVTAMLPFAELRGAIPMALCIFKMNPVKAYILAVTGNIIPVVPLLIFLEPVEQKLRRFRIFDSFFEWLFNRTHARTNEKIQKYGAIGLVPFVAIPLPVTGAWTGVAASYIFNIKFKHAFIAIALGVMIAGVIVTLASMGVIHIAFINSLCFS